MKYLFIFRRDTKPAESYPFSSPLLKGRKRVAIAERTEKAADGGSKKKSRVVDDSASDSSDNVQNESYVEAVTQKRKIMETEKEPPSVSETVVLYQRSVVPDFCCFSYCYFIS